MLIYVVCLFALLSWYLLALAVPWALLLTSQVVPVVSLSLGLWLSVWLPVRPSLTSRQCGTIGSGRHHRLANNLNVP